MESKAFAATANSLFKCFGLESRSSVSHRVARTNCFPTPTEFPETRSCVGQQHFAATIVSTPTSSDFHEPVLKRELVDSIVTDRCGVYLDATFGRGGHAKAVLDALDAAARVIALDRDAAALKASVELEQADSRLTFVRARFGMMGDVLARHKVQVLDGVYFDVGVSTPQLKDPLRGFAFDLDGPLDMRMDVSSGVPASVWLEHANVEELGKILRIYGDVGPAKAISRRIVAVRPIATTAQLVTAIKNALPRERRSVRLIAQVFQAIRIFINDELNELQSGIQQAFTALKPGGRLAAITFHSLEHRLVRACIQSWINPLVPRGLPIKSDPPRARVVLKNARPTYAERQRNPSSRSAMLQVVERVR